MTVSKKATRGLEPELVEAFAPLMAGENKTGSNAAFYGEMEGGRYDFPDAVAKLLNREIKKMRGRRRRLLLELANLRDPKTSPIRCKKMMQPFGFDPPPSAEAVQKAQWTLQYIWRRDLAASAKQKVVHLFLDAAVLTPQHGGVFASLLSQQLEFDPKNFAGQLVIGILENWPGMVKCANPECEESYFFAKRTTQKYCERGECTRYALRKKALKHWRKKYGKSTEGKEQE